MGPRRRQPPPCLDDDGTAVARSGARGVSQPVRRAKDAGTDRAYAEDREAATELRRTDGEGSCSFRLQAEVDESQGPVASASRRKSRIAGSCSFRLQAEVANRGFL